MQYLVVSTFLLIILTIFLWETKWKLLITFLWIVFLGILANRFVVAFNDGYMPVFIKKIDTLVDGFVKLSERHQLGTEHTRLAFLGDVFDVPHVGIVSIGDILIVVALVCPVLWCFNSHKKRNVPFLKNNTRFSYTIVFFAMIVPYLYIAYALTG